MVLWAVWAVLWAAVLREAPRMHTPLDEMWLHGVLAERTAPRTEATGDQYASAGDFVERTQDLG